MIRAVRLLEPWRSRVLWLSLGLNLFAVALVAAQAVWPQLHAHGRQGPPGPPSFDALVQRIAGGLQPPDAEAFRTAMGKERPWYEMGRQRLEEAREQVAASVSATPYDPAATTAALQAMQERMRESGTRFDESLAMAVGTLSSDGRTHLAQTLRRRRP